MTQNHCTEDAGDYGGSCDTCERGQVKLGHRLCPACERRIDQAALDQLHDDINEDIANDTSGGRWK